MRFRFVRSSRDPSLRRLDITPLVDVVFLLLIFFMLTSNYVLQAGIKVTLPSARDTFTLPPARVEVFITADDVIYMGPRRVTPDELLLLLEDARATRDTVLIFADVDCRHGRVVEVEDVCRRAGFTDISVATRPVEPEPGKAEP